MKQILTIPVDFGNADEDGAVRLVTEGTVEHLRFHNIELSEGMKVTLSDGELTADGTRTKRDSMWVVLVERWTKYDHDPKKWTRWPPNVRLRDQSKSTRQLKDGANALAAMKAARHQTHALAALEPQMRELALHLE